MLTAMVLICATAAAVDAQECTRTNANTVLGLPAEFGNPTHCLDDRVRIVFAQRTDQYLWAVKRLEGCEDDSCHCAAKSGGSPS
jgi:hypothetical protein